MTQDGFRRRADRPHVVINGPTHHERGAQRGRQLRDELPEAMEWYLRFFRNAHVDDATARDGALRTLDTIGAWRAGIVEEYEGIARAASLDPWHIAALNARTEVLASSPTGVPGECSTLVYTDARRAAPLGGQTWDWNEELNDFWHTASVAGPQHSFASLTEHGILGKIGVNDAGLGVLFNILGHRGDGPNGVPVHVLSAVILAECASVEEAVDLLHTAKIASSTALTLIDRQAARTVELSPAGIAEITPSPGFYAHTNHFLDDVIGEGEKGLYAPDTHDRMELLGARFSNAAPPVSPRDLARLLTSGEGEAHLCAAPHPDDPFGRRWRTLATVAIDPESATLEVLDGSPLEREDRPWRTLSATSPGMVDRSV